MRNYLTTTVVITGLFTSLAGIADNGLTGCLQENANRSDKNTYCISQMQQSAISDKKKSLEESYKQTKTQLDDQLKALSQKVGSAPAGSPPSASTSSQTASTQSNTTSVTPSAPPSASAQTQSATQDNAAKQSSPISPPKATPVPPKGFEKKPASVQWY